VSKLQSPELIDTIFDVGNFTSAMSPLTPKFERITPNDWFSHFCWAYQDTATLRHSTHVAITHI